MTLALVVLVGAVVVWLAFLALSADRVVRREPTAAEQIARLAAQLDEVSRQIGEAIRPALEAVARAVVAWDRAWKRPSP